MTKPRARDLGIPLEGSPGSLNGITDLPGLEVGFTTLIAGDAIRTSVTILHPRGKANHDPVFAGWFPLNGNGELTGAAWLEEGAFSKILLSRISWMNIPYMIQYSDISTQGAY